MEWSQVAGIAVICAVFGVAFYIYRGKIDGSIFVDALVKLVGLIVNAEKQIQGEKMGSARMDRVVEMASSVLTAPELKVVEERGGISKVVQYAFNILKVIGTLGLVKGVRN